MQPGHSPAQLHATVGTTAITPHQPALLALCDPKPADHPL